MNIKYVRDTVTRYGVQAAATNIAYRAACKVIDVTILKGVSLTNNSLDRTYVEEDAGYRWRFLDGDTLRRAVRRRGAALEMDEAFLDDALARGDRCYGALDGDTIAAYGWYSTIPTPITDDMILHFDSAYAYMYKGYTLREYRGKRLHGIGMARAMDAYVREGRRGLVSVVDAANFASLRSCYRLGYRSFGQLVYARIAGRYFTYATGGCEEYSFYLTPSKPHAAVTAD